MMQAAQTNNNVIPSTGIHAGEALLPSGSRQKANELLSEEVQEVISYRPHWLVRKGSAIFFIMIVSMLSFSFFVRYPDTISADARLVSLYPPQMVKAGATGRVEKLFIRNEDTVQQDQHLGYIGSNASYTQVMQLQQWVLQAVTAMNKNIDVVSTTTLPVLNNLGELQEVYQQFEQAWQTVRQTRGSGYYQRKQEELKHERQYIAALKRNIDQQVILQQHDQQLQQKEYDAYESLAKDKVIAPLELDQYKSKLIAKQQASGQMNAQVTNNAISLHNKNKEILDLQKQMADQQQQFHAALLELKSKLEEWVTRFVLRAPGAGKIVFNSSLVENEWLTEGQVLFYLQLPQSSFYVEIMAGQNGLGKLREGQQVIVKVEGYPENEFGHLEATVDYIAGISSRRDSFLLKAKLTNGLQTNYGKTVLFREGLRASASIITDERMLAERITGPLKQLWSR